MSKLYPDEIKQFIAANVVGVSSVSLAKLTNNTFGTQYSAAQIKSHKCNNKLVSGLNGQFEKGHVPENKGKKGVHVKGCEKGWFKKGGVPRNHRPVGSERIDSKDGYLLVKVAEPNKWKLKQRVVWENYHGVIPRGYKIIFLDKCNTNISIDNLALVSNTELLIMNKQGLRSEDPKLTETGILIATVIKQKTERRKVSKVQA